MTGRSPAPGADLFPNRFRSLPRILLPPHVPVAIGPGKTDLLRSVREARSLGVPYKRAWLRIDSLNIRLGRPVVDTATGGNDQQARNFRWRQRKPPPRPLVRRKNSSSRLGSSLPVLSSILGSSWLGISQEIRGRKARKGRLMATISTFYGILIQMFWSDHAPPHFHALYAEHEVLIDIRTLGTSWKARCPGGPSP